MKKFIVEHSFWDTFPEAQINLLLVRGIQNQYNGNDSSSYAELLSQAKKEASKYLVEETFSENDIISQWREAFRSFKTKKGARSSIEALLKRAHQDQEFRPINPLVDIYNAISLTYAVPCGGEDLEKIAGNLHLGMAAGGESFLPLGADSDSPALPGEMIYYDNEGAVCRCLNWREAQRTMLDNKTTDAVFFMESIHSDQALRADKAILELQKMIHEKLNVSGTLFKINRDNSSVFI